MDELMDKLATALNHACSDSDELAAALAGIKAQGCDVRITVQIDVKRLPAKRAAKSSKRPSPPVFHITGQDLKFLQGLRISVGDVT